ncbi:cysteine protease LapG [Pseudomonas sp. KNUC1026]|uniref:cysteine protease LapG n=1 Tax=Pseudomonas sp. KNUC1026 TaxID=2893890 RepID=UPI001F3D97D4|nr:transglutaminase-like cysteine peptidase [Pseudomonas sp. KNUC1026]UFH49459.1 transglutaminase-like cysteine peptidase [Pseudomonas sp. KNUC1026]
MPLFFAECTRTMRSFPVLGRAGALAKSTKFTRRLGQWLLAFWLGIGLLAGLQADWDFNTISRKAEALYGPLGAGKQRIDAWQKLLLAQRQSSEMEKLTAVNLFFNRQMRYVEDIDLWGQVDYWETPIEALWKGAGDCEDYAIAKYFSLRHLGVASDKLRITYVKALRQNRAHMVLTYYATPEAVPLVLDSLQDPIQPATERTDLLPVYSFNGEGYWLAGSGSNKRVGDAKRLSRWQDVIQKMTAEGFPTPVEQ